MELSPGAPVWARPGIKTHMPHPDQSARWVGAVWHEPGRGHVISRCGRWVYVALGERLHQRPYSTTCLACAHSWRREREPRPPLTRIVFQLKSIDPETLIAAAEDLGVEPHEFAWEALRDRLAEANT